MDVPPPVEERFVVALPRASGRLFSVDYLHDQWSGHLFDAEKFTTRHSAEEAARLHGALVLPMREALQLEAA